MSSTLLLIAGLVVLCALLGAGAPIFIGFLVVNLLGVLALFGTAGFGMFAGSMLESMSSLSLTTIPLFVLMGEILFRSGAVDVVLDSVDHLVGRIHGRLYLFTMVLSTLFGALCGSAVAVVAMLGRTVLPTMHARGYDARLSASLIQGGASLAPIIPPSLMAVLIGSMANVSISSLLIAGLLPGLLLAAMSVGYAWWCLWRDPSLAPREDASATIGPRQPLRALARLLPFTVIIFAVMGLMLLGVATPSEAAATGVMGSLATAAWYRRLSWAMLQESIRSTVTIASMILVILAVSVFFGQLLNFTGATAQLVERLATIDLPPMAMFWLLMIVPFVLCMFIDQLAFMLVAIPIYAPLAARLGFDPVWFWTQFSINMTLASLTPPFGYTMYALRAAAPDLLTMKQVFDASWPITWVFVAGMAVMSVFPGIITWLPGLLK
ncbi:TRAP transporter large permease subunit [Ramlibacter sp.]|uniref:TRAP transporter large permease n=1 Tax=Ramlibacter sp. TaxID=1917967 RepID=UPI0035B32330